MTRYITETNIDIDNVCEIQSINDFDLLNTYFKQNVSLNQFGLSCLTINIRSLRENFSKLILTLESLKFKPKIIICTETWISTYETSLYSISDYESIFSCNDSYRAGGVAIFLNKSLEITNQKIFNFTTADNLFVEFRYADILFSLLALYSCKQQQNLILIEN